MKPSNRPATARRTADRTPKRAAPPARGHRPAPHRMRRTLWIIGGSAAAVSLLFVLFLAGRSGGPGGTESYQVARPATGERAPAFTLPSTQGGSVSLASMRGRSVLLFFQEGIGCEPCWQQVKDLERSDAQLKAAGIDKMVTITTNTLDQLRQKAQDEGLSSPVLADTDFTASHAYNANTYGMMGDAADGHTFVLVGPDGTIRWRADYGGPPDYTMYVPITQLLGNMRSAGARQ